MQRIQLYCIPLLVLFFLMSVARGANADTPTVALLSPDDSRFWQMVGGFSQAVARDLGITLTVYTDPEKNRFSYRKLLAQVLASEPKPDYVMFMAKEMVTRDMLEMAGNAGVKVFTFNTDIPVDELDDVGMPRQVLPHWIGHVAPNNRSAAKHLADALLAAARENTPDNSQDRWGVIALSGTRDSSAAKDRDLGLADALADKTLQLYQLVYADWSENEAFDKTLRLIRRYPAVDIVWSASDGMALGTIDALEASGLTPGQNVVVGGLDWEQRALDAIRNGRMFGSMGRHYMGGGLALLLIHDHHAGYDFNGSGDKSLTYQLELVSQDNLAQIERSLNPATWDSVDFRRFSRVYNAEIQSPGMTANELMDQFMNSLTKDDKNH